MKIQLVHPEAQVPTRGTRDSGGLDMYSVEAREILPGEVVALDTGVAVAIPKDWVGLMRSRSGHFFNHGLHVEGTIDADYRGTVKVMVFNHGLNPFWVFSGDRICQMVVVPCLMEGMEVVDALDETSRGNKGFGSTGNN